MDDNDWPPEFPYRGWETDPGRTKAHNNLISLLLERLAKLEEETRPSGGDETAKRKDLKAFEAIHTAMWLVKTVAGWAIDHQIGLAQQELEFVPIQPVANRQHPDYLALLSAVDSHDHERNGSSYRHADWPEDPKFKRRALINLLHAMQRDSTSLIFGPAEEALRALDFGDVLPILREQKGNRKAGYKSLHLQLKAIGFVEFHKALGMKKNVAQEMVAGAYGLSVDAIRNWEIRLRDAEKGVGALKVSREVIWARNSASHIIAARKGQGSKETAAHHLERYDHDAIAKAGAAFRKALAEEQLHRRPTPKQEIDPEANDCDAE